MIKLTYSELFQFDLENAINWLHEAALASGSDPIELEEMLKTELIEKVTLIQDNPFLYPAYGKNNPTRRVFLMSGNYVLEYQVVPHFAKSKVSTNEVILTTLVPTRSNKYSGAYEELESVSFESLFED